MDHEPIAVISSSLHAVYTHLELRTMSLKVNTIRCRIFVAGFKSVEHSDSSNSLPTSATPGVRVKDQFQQRERIISSPAQNSQTLVDYAFTWHRQQQHQGRSIPTTTSINAERQTWSQTLPSQQRVPVLHIQMPSSTLNGFSGSATTGSNPVTHQRGHRRTQSSSNVIEYGTIGSGYSDGVSLTSDGDYDRLDSRQPQQQLLGQRQLQQQQFSFATSSQPVQFHTQPRELPLAGAAVQQPPLISSVHRQQQQSTWQASAAPVRNGYRRTQSTGLTDQFGNGPAGGWSHQQHNSMWNGGIINHHNQAPRQQLDGTIGVNGDWRSTSFVPVQQRLVDTAGISSSIMTGSLPGHYRRQLQQPTVVPHNGHSFQQITVNNSCYEPHTLLRQEPGRDVVGGSRQNFQPSASSYKYRQMTNPEIVLHPPPQSPAKGITTSQLASVVYHNGKASRHRL